MKQRLLPAWLPKSWPTESDWTPQFQDYFQSDLFRELCEFVAMERSDQLVYPSAENVFQAFRLTSCADTKIVILGQDPYHGSHQAHGLAFSVLPGTKVPPSLRNIFKELANDVAIDGISQTTKGDLTSWATQGVLLLNTVLTVRNNDPNSHQRRGWENFTDHVISCLNSHAENLVFILWGKPAAKKINMIDQRHTILTAPHPSPLSSYRGFFGSRPFTQANAALELAGRKSIRWESILD